MKHIKYYATVKRHLKAYFDRQMKQSKHDLAVFKRCFGNPKCWDEKDQIYRTDEPTRWSEVGRPVFKEDIESEELRLYKSLPADRKYWEDRLEAADNAGKLIEMEISVNWVRSKTWGSNPHAECRILFEDAEYGTRSAYSEGRASGCGYDKRSAAVQEAFEFGLSKTTRDNADSRKDLALARASFDRFVIEHGPKLWKAYAIDKSQIPTFNISGKGMSTFTGLFRRIGCRYNRNPTVKDYLIDYSEPERGSDMYHVIRKDRV